MRSDVRGICIKGEKDMKAKLAMTRREALEWLGLGMAGTVLPVSAGGNNKDPNFKGWDSVIPTVAPAKPIKPRRILIFNRNVNAQNLPSGGHGSIATATEAFTLMGKRTGAFETVVSRDQHIFSKDSLKTFDAVCLNDTVGNIFTEPDLRQNLMEFITGGGGLIGLHGVTAAFSQLWSFAETWPEMGCVIGGRGASHRSMDEDIVMRIEEPEHPLMAAFGGATAVPWHGEFPPRPPYSRIRNRVLASIDIKASHLENEPHDNAYRADQDYGLVWVRRYGRGRIFMTTLGHHDAEYQSPVFLKMMLAGFQFVAGDLDVPVIPSARLTPAIRAQEKLGWCLGLEAYTFYKKDFFYTVDQAAANGMAYVGGLDFQRVSPAMKKNFTPDLSDDELREIRMKLDATGIRLLTYFYCGKFKTEAECRKVFEFGKKMGVECFMSEPDLAAMPMVDRFCKEYGIKLGIHNHDAKISPNNWNPDQILKICERLSPMVGACADVGFWMRNGIDPVQAAGKLKGRLITLQMHDLDGKGADVPWGKGTFDYKGFLQKLRELNVKPVMFGLEYSDRFDDNLKEVKECADYFNALSLAFAKEAK